mmetsp:Transcript_92544/g.160812  ORF Transcript_92544/g.160812 Transcript_92544/m.160812 type:complete len:194 (-) Transcript_92544:36-617(-)
MATALIALLLASSSAVVAHGATMGTAAAGESRRGVLLRSSLRHGSMAWQPAGVQEPDAMKQWPAVAVIDGPVTHGRPAPEGGTVAKKPHSEAAAHPPEAFGFAQRLPSAGVPARNPRATLMAMRTHLRFSMLRRIEEQRRREAAEQEQKARLIVEHSSGQQGGSAGLTGLIVLGFVGSMLIVATLLKLSIFIY